MSPGAAKHFAEDPLVLAPEVVVPLVVPVLAPLVLLTVLPPLVVVLVFVLLAPLLVDVLVELFPVGLELLHASAPIPRPNTATAPTRQLNRTEFMALSFSN